MRKIYLMLVLFGTAFFTLNAQISILVVNDNSSSDDVSYVENSLTRLGYNFANYNAVTEAASPSLEVMSAFDLVYWHTGKDGGGLYFWNGDETENQLIKDYIDGGGMLWVEGTDFLHDKYAATPQTFFAGEFVYDYLGISSYFAQSKNDDGDLGLPELNVVKDNGIFTQDTLRWRWSTQWYADALEKVENAVYLYQMGPADYPLRDYHSAIYNEVGDGKIISFAFRFDGIDSLETADSIMQQGLTYFEQFTTSKVLVTDISVEADGGTPAITENEGTLQFSATVLPEDADLKAVSWSVVSNSVNVNIDQSGLLKASGTRTGNGVVYVKAEAMDGSGVKDSIEVSISGQGANEFIALLVNDNANGVDRYMEIDTALSELNYLYHIYNTVETGTYPGSVVLEGYDMVIWYTGNDGVSLKLWDVSDSTKIKFNAPLMQYIENGGDVWLQGLDFMFDIYGGAPDEFVAGDFVYDYLGIKTYVAQSHADGDDLTQLDVVTGNPMVNFTPVKDQFGGIWYADAYEITDAAQGIYKMGPAEYVYSDYYAGILNEKGDAKIFTLSYETARMDAAANMVILYDDVMDYFASFWVGTEEKELNTSLTDSPEVFPNPATDFISVKWNLQQNSDVELQFYSISGRLVHEEHIPGQSGGLQEYRFSTSEIGMIPGVYILRSKSVNGSSSNKIIIK